MPGSTCPSPDRIADRQLTELTASGDHQEWFAEKLAAWLETWGNTATTAERLGIHPQTVRYRLNKIATALGGRLDDPEAPINHHVTGQVTARGPT
jgi:DNA-binding PucR family transcriptional regulator